MFQTIRQIKKRNNSAWTVSVSRTPWARSPKDISGLLAVLQIGSEEQWSSHPVLQNAIGLEWKAIIAAFESTATATKKSEEMARRITELANVIELLVVCRKTESQWGKRAIVPLWLTGTWN